MSGKIIYISTVVRAAPIAEGGQVLKVDWERKKILKKIKIYPTDPPIVDPNPRGGARGGRGILLLNNEVYVATYHSIHVYDLDLNLKRIITNNQFVGVHEIETDGKHLWVTSTAIDTLVQTDLDGNLVSVYNARSDEHLQNEFGLKPLDISYNGDNRLKFLDDHHLKDSSHVHLNAVALNGAKKYISMHSYGSIIELPTSKVIYESASLKGFHNIKVIDEKYFLINDTKNRNVLVLDFNTGELLRSIDVMKNFSLRLRKKVTEFYLNVLRSAISKQYHTRTFFLRGLTRISENKILIGTSPAGLIEVDFENGKVTDSFFFENNPSFCVHGLELYE